MFLPTPGAWSIYSAVAAKYLVQSATAACKAWAALTPAEQLGIVAVREGHELQGDQHPPWFAPTRLLVIGEPDATAAVTPCEE